MSIQANKTYNFDGRNMGQKMPRIAMNINLLSLLFRDVYIPLTICSDEGVLAI